MAIDFTPERWASVKETYSRWWAGGLNRPVVELVLNGRDPGRPQPKAPVLTQATCADFSIPAADLIDRLDYELSKKVYLGDSFPMVNMDSFGPGVVAAFLGAQIDSSTGAVWFHPPSDISIEDLHFSYDPGNIWLRRIKEICAAAMDRWQGQVLVGMTDLGGTLDILSSFRPSEKLPMDLIDSPEEVKRLVGEIHELWHRFRAEIDDVLQPVNPGYTSWCQIYSDKPFYICQSDFSFMISADMFREFVRDELDACTRRLPRSFYHCDGAGQLPHLDMLLAMDHLDGVQWEPGEGALGFEHWIDVYKKIFSAGKKTQLHKTNSEVVLKVLREAGHGGGVHCRLLGGDVADERAFRKDLSKLAEY